MAKDLLLRLHEPRFAYGASEASLRRIDPRPLFCLPLSKEHHPFKPQLLLVGADIGVPARLPTYVGDPLALRLQTPSRGGVPQHLHLARERAIRSAFASQLCIPHRHPRRPIYLRATDETLDDITRNLARRLLRHLPILAERFGGGDEIW